MGLTDFYPFVISPPAVDKFRFIHEIIGHVGARDETGRLPSRADRTLLQCAPDFQRVYHIESGHWMISAIPTVDALRTG